MHAADDDSSTLLPASAGIERNAADKAESAARAAASRVTAWLQRSPTGPLARASCADAASAPESASPSTEEAANDEPSADAEGRSAKADSALTEIENSVAAPAPGPARSAD